MEEKIRMTNERINSLEKRIEKVEDQVDSNYDKIHEVDDKHNQRHLENTVLITTLRETVKAMENNTKAISQGMSDMVNELKLTNKSNTEEFGKVHGDISEIKNQLKSNSEELSVRLEEKRLGNKTIIAILTGIFGLFEAFTRLIFPMFFGN